MRRIHRNSESQRIELTPSLHSTIFLSSSESQTGEPFRELCTFCMYPNATFVSVVNSLWRGDWVQQNNDKNDIDYVQYKPKRTTFWDHIDPSRICVPRYQNWFRVRVLLPHSRAFNSYHRLHRSSYGCSSFLHTLKPFNNLSR